jgi:hypothetical protein
MRLWIAQESVCETSEDSRRATAARNRQSYPGGERRYYDPPLQEKLTGGAVWKRIAPFYKLCQIFLVRTKSEEEQ